MNILEKDLEDLIWGCIEEGHFQSLAEIGLHLHGNKGIWERQKVVGVKNRLDIFYINYTRTESIIIELKKGSISQETIKQLERYNMAVMKLHPKLKNVRKIAIGNNIDLYEQHEDIELLSYDFSILTGLRFYSFEETKKLLFDKMRAAANKIKLNIDFDNDIQY